VLGKVVKTVWCQADCSHNLRGKRGGKLEPGEKCFTVRKLGSGCGSSELHHAEVEGDEGLLVVPACNLVASNVVLVLPTMHRGAMEAALGTEHDEMSRAETTKVMACLHACLPNGKAPGFGGDVRSRAPTPL
jgi:hypothetical protein